MVLCDRGNHQEGTRLVREALDNRRSESPPAPERLALAEAVLGHCLTVERQFVNAEPLLTHAHATLVEQPPTAREDARNAAAWLVELYEKWGKPKEAAEWRTKQRR